MIGAALMASNSPAQPRQGASSGPWEANNPMAGWLAWCESHVEREAANAIAEHYGADAGGVACALAGVPDNLRALLASPEGWSVLGGFLAGVQSTPFVPAVH
jgi:hypothetical protein